MMQSIASRIGRAPALVAALVVALIACLVLRGQLRHHDDDDDNAMWPNEPPLAQITNWLRAQEFVREMDTHRCERPRDSGSRAAGIVLDDHGRPVARAVVRLSTDLTTTTAADGSFEIASHRYGIGEPTATATKGDLVGIAAWKGDLEHLVIRLVPEHVLVRVRGIDEVAIAGATVTLYDAQRAVVARRVADDAGIASFSHVGDATRMIATMRGFAEREIELPLEQQRPIEVTARLHPTGMHLVDGRVLDHLGRPAAGVRVHTRPDVAAVTDADGAFRLWAEEAESYEIDAFEPNGVATGKVAASATSTTGLVVRLDPPKYPMIAIDVTVVDMQGRPVPDAEIHEQEHWIVDRWTYVPIGFDETRPKRTDARGHAVFHVRARGGDIAVAARHDEGSSDLVRVTLVDVYHEPVGASPQMAVTLLLKPSRISGVVVDEIGEPVPDALVYVDREREPGEHLHLNETSEWTRTGSDGRFAVSPWRGKCRVRASAIGCRYATFNKQETFEAPRDGLRIVVRPVP